MLPKLEEGVLPAGIHQATMSEVTKRFGWNEHRERLLGGLEAVLKELATNGCRRAWLDGSFVTDKERPRDFDLVWDPEGVDLDQLDPVLGDDLDPPRTAQHVKFGGDVLPNIEDEDSGQPFVDFFQQSSVTGMTRGIVEINLEGMT